MYLKSDFVLFFILFQGTKEKERMRVRGGFGEKKEVEQGIVFFVCSQPRPFSKKKRHLSLLLSLCFFSAPNEQRKALPPSLRSLSTHCMEKKGEEENASISNVKHFGVRVFREQLRFEGFEEENSSFSVLSLFLQWRRRRFNCRLLPRQTLPWPNASSPRWRRPRVAASRARKVKKEGGSDG